MKSLAAWLLAICCLPFMAVAEEKSELYFPPADGSWEQVSPGKLGWNVAKLKEALAYAGEQKSSGVVILYRGRILAEQYWDLDTAKKEANGQRNRYAYMCLGKNAQGRAIEDVASAQKSVVAMLVGIAQHKGLLKITDPVHKHLGKGWSKAPAEAEAKITIQHLISMNSGLDTQLQYQVPPGKKWMYNTNAYSRSLMCVAKVANMKPTELTAKWITEPTGMKDSRWATRPWVSMRADANRVGFATTARDLARFGLLMLANGNWDGKNLIQDKAYIKEALSPSQKQNPSYGYLWWLNRNRPVAGSDKPGGRMVFSAPPDMYAAKGALARRVYVLPTQQVVITRLGDQAGKDFDGQFFKRLKMAIRK